MVRRMTVSLIITMFITFMAGFIHNAFFWVIAGLLWMVYGFSYWTTNSWISIGTVLFGIVCFIGAKYDGSRKK